MFCYGWNSDIIFISNKACVYSLVVRARFVFDTKIACGQSKGCLGFFAVCTLVGVVRQDDI